MKRELSREEVRKHSSFLPLTVDVSLAKENRGLECLMQELKFQEQ